ncbi:hypothetical protein EER27_10260 [Lysobacter psychrotolerans]|uniref:Uncharacterized protein n=2 Tax=Montanilutibacter psychrotolerans TaxID=1327343 RepID=A0A3M8SWB5_9GAMM|nr:hypothetical protein EER27_10260 [Lysobacter psychrotolerans]
MAGLGASFALLVANIDSVAKYIYAYSFRWALFWFSASLLLGLLARFLAVTVFGGLNSNEALSKQLAGSISSAKRFSFPAFIHFLFSGLLLPYKCIASSTFDKVKRGDLMASARLTAKTSQLQALLVLGQIVCSTASVLVLASGIKA